MMRIRAVTLPYPKGCQQVGAQIYPIFLAFPGVILSELVPFEAELFPDIRQDLAKLLMPIVIGAQIRIALSQTKEENKRKGEEGGAQNKGGRRQSAATYLS